jgi:hypothetical protein
VGKSSCVYSSREKPSTYRECMQGEKSKGPDSVLSCGVELRCRILKEDEVVACCKRKYIVLYFEFICSKRHIVLQDSQQNAQGHVSILTT